MRFGLREIVFLLVLLAMPMSAYWFLFKPRNAEIEEARKEIAHKERKLEELDLAVSQRADLELKITEMTDKIRRIEAQLPTDKDLDKILQQVAELARGHELDIPAVKAQPALKSSKYMEKPLDMTIKGDHDRFYAFLLDLEQLERITRMPTLRIERSTENNGEIEAAFTLSVYFEPTRLAMEDVR
jgi:type IV pilus assembly protein PilO